MEIIVWVILFSILMGVVLVVQYWADLMRQKESYTREELLDFIRIIPERLQKLAGKDELAMAIAALAAGIVAAWLLTLLGGLFSENVVADVPDHAEAGVPNYFFQSALFVFVLHIAWPSFKDFALDRGGEEGMLFKILSAELPFFVGLSVTIASINLTCWGVFHEMTFLFVLPDMLILLVYAGYRIDQVEHPHDGPGRKSGNALKRRPLENDEF